MSNKSPFEIRTDIFAMAKDYMDKAFAAQKDTAETMLKLGRISQEQYLKSLEMYKPEDLVKQAEDFYQKFVCKK